MLYTSPSALLFYVQAGYNYEGYYSTKEFCGRVGTCTYQFGIKYPKKGGGGKHTSLNCCIELGRGGGTPILVSSREALHNSQYLK